MIFKKMVDGVEKEVVLLQDKEDNLYEILLEDINYVSSIDGTTEGLAVFHISTGETYYALHTNDAFKKLAELIGVPFESEELH